jgi:hypothetical protein
MEWRRKAARGVALGRGVTSAPAEVLEGLDVNNRISKIATDSVPNDELPATGTVTVTLNRKFEAAATPVNMTARNYGPRPPDSAPASHVRLSPPVSSSTGPHQYDGYG